MDREHETEETADTPARKEYRPPTWTRIEVGRGSASGSEGLPYECSEYSGAPYCTVS